VVGHHFFLLRHEADPLRVAGGGLYEGSGASGEGGERSECEEGAGR
jgi:hypothetical protein